MRLSNDYHMHYSIGCYGLLCVCMLSKHSIILLIIVWSNLAFPSIAIVKYRKSNFKHTLIKPVSGVFESCDPYCCV